MNASERTEVPWQMDQVKAHRGNPSVAQLQEVCFSEQSRHGSPVQPNVPQEPDFQDFVDGADI